MARSPAVHSVPNLMAAIWTSGRETMLVDDHLDRTTKEAICGVLSDLNDCPYCGDMLISLVDAGKEHDAASAIYEGGVGRIEDPRLREQLAWVQAVGTAGLRDIPPCPFTPEELPEVLGSLMAMADINRFSHVVMDGSPVNLPFGLQRPALRLFGRELEATKTSSAEPGRALDLLPPADLPDDLAWAAPNPRIADAIARWTAVVARETAEVIPAAVRELVESNLRGWNNEEMPLSRSWVEKELGDLEGDDRDIARLALLLAKAPHQVSADIVEGLAAGGEERFVRILAWAAFVGARRFVGIVADNVRFDDDRGRPAKAASHPRARGVIGLLLAAFMLTVACESTGPPKIETHARAVTQESATITWSGVRGAHGYAVRRDGREVFLAGPDARQWVDSSLQPGRQYRYEVQAVQLTRGTSRREGVSRVGTVRVRTDEVDGWQSQVLDFDPPISSLRIDGAGVRHVVHEGPDGVLVHSAEFGGVWSSTPVAPGRRPELALQPDGELAVAFERAGALWIASRAGGEWSTEQVEPGPVDPESELDLAVAEDGALHIAFVEKDGGLKHATNESGSWSAEWLDMNPQIRYVAITARGGVHVLSISDRTLIDRVRRTDGWEVRGIAANTEWPFDAKVDDGGVLHVVAHGGNFVRHHAWDGAGWSRELITITSGTHADVALAIGFDGQLHVGYVGDADELRYATNASGVWESMRVDSDLDLMQAIRVGVDGAGRVDLIYGDLSLPGRGGVRRVQIG